MEFKGWTAPSTVRIDDRLAVSTTLTMPETDVSVAAQYETKIHSVRLTPDQGEPVRSGTVWNTGTVSNPNQIALGDSGRGKSQRAFITFDLSVLPAGVDIRRADLVMRLGGANGDPAKTDPGASGFFGNFVVESVDIGSKLDAGDYNKAGLSLGQYPTRLFRDNWNTTHPVDVPTAILSALSAGKRSITFRLRFLSEWDNDDEGDSIALDDRGDRLRLEIDYAS